MEKTGVSQHEDGQGLVEYALIILFIAIALVISLNLMGISLSDVYQRVLAGLSGEDLVCSSLAQAGNNWDALQDGFWRGGIKSGQGQYRVCQLCGGLLPGFSGSDYQIDLTGTSLKNELPAWNGYGVAFRADYNKKGLSGYTFEIEKANKNRTTQIYFSKWVNGKQIKPPLSVLELSSDIDWNTPPNISVKAEGDQFTAYMNGKEVLRAKDNTYARGKAGVISNLGTTLFFNGFNIAPPGCVEGK